MKVLILNNVPAPYFSPLFEKLGQEAGWQLTVCYTTSWNSTVGWQAKSPEENNSYRMVTLDQMNPTLSGKVGSYWAASLALVKALRDEQPDYLICYGYTLKPQIALLLWAVWTKTPFALIGDANYFCDRVAGLKRIVKTAWLRFVTKKAAALITIGKASRLFWEKYGASASQLFTSCLAVDNEFFRKAGEAGNQKASELRAELKFEDKVVFLFVGRLIKRKNVDLILQAAQRLKSDRFGIVIAGSGEESEPLKLQFGDNPNVFFAGNIAPNELPVFYQMADVLVLPADQEPWGLVINEAMNCGLAIIAHQHCGAAIDLIDADNGIKLQGFSVEELMASIELLLVDPVKLQAMQKSSQTKVQYWSINNAAAGIIQAVESTHSKK